MEVVQSKDGRFRSAHVQYKNSSEEAPRTSFRAARSLMQLFNIDDQTRQSDMSKVEGLMKLVENETDGVKNGVAELGMKTLLSRRRGS